MASTDKALAAFTDIKTAEAEALGKRTLADRSDERIIFEDSLKIMNEANKTSQGSLTIAATRSGSKGMIIGDLLIRDENAKGHNDVSQVPVALFKKDEKTNLWNFDEQVLDIDTIWYDPNKKKVLTITMEGDKKVADYHSSAEEARNFLGKKSKDTGTVNTGGVATGEGEGTQEKAQIEGAQGITITIDEGDWNHGTTLSGNLIRNGKVYDKKTKRLIPNKNLNYLGNNKMHPFGYAKKDTPSSGSYIDQSGSQQGEDVFIYLDENEPSHPSKIIKEEKEKDYSDLDKWWKTQTSNYGSGYQGVN
tara:strand:- start:234 stop:1148 length:915 start_codon:yes stop_codon:yes gene_type:complete